MPARMKKMGDLLRLGIDSGQVRAFMEVAPMTSQGEVIGRIVAAVLLGDDVFDVKWDGSLMISVKKAVFAAAASSLCDPPAESRVNHAARCFASQARALAWRTEIKSMART